MWNDFRNVFVDIVAVFQSVEKLFGGSDKLQKVRLATIPPTGIEPDGTAAVN